MYVRSQFYTRTYTPLIPPSSLPQKSNHRTVHFDDNPHTSQLPSPPAPAAAAPVAEASELLMSPPRSTLAGLNPAVGSTLCPIDSPTLTSVSIGTSEFLSRSSSNLRSTRAASDSDSESASQYPHQRRKRGNTHRMRLLGKSATMVLPPYAKYPSSSPRFTVSPLCAVHRMLPTCSTAAIRG